MLIKKENIVWGHQDPKTMRKIEFAIKHALKGSSLQVESFDITQKTRGWSSYATQEVEIRWVGGGSVFINAHQNRSAFIADLKGSVEEQIQYNNYRNSL